MEALRGPDAETLLVRALRSQGMKADIVIAVRSIASRPWASATFVGTSHCVKIEARPGESFDRWVADLPDREWTLRGHLVADVVVDRVTKDAAVATLLMSVLTIEDN